MNELKVREIAIKRHDLDAGFFKKNMKQLKTVLQMNLFMEEIL